MGSPGQNKGESMGNSESVREFISIAVHDLREPLRSIRTSSDVLAAACEDPADEKTARCLRFIQEGVGRMELLIHDLSEYCYEEVREFDRVRVSLEGVLLEAKNQLAGELDKNAAIFSYDPLPAVKGDPDGLTALFRCLIENACKFRGEQTLRIHVKAAEVEAASGGSEWVVSVQDNGIGFNPQYSDRIFRPFERLNGRRYPGSGLGLALAKRIVERHSGRIWADSKLGEGCLCSFTLPPSD
jgi:light-regulated signal transduction histidine kinase (bacteriophytochrome)